jgi:DNA-binding MarR family transcriptional regulator
MDLESRIHAEHPDELRLWLRLMTCTQLIEKRVRMGLRTEFDTTLPRFDLMAQLEKFPAGLKMGELSKRLMVSGGNVTTITDQLVVEGWVQRVDVKGDRRAWKIQLTKAGRSYFNEMAMAHESWILESFEGLQRKDIQSLYKLLALVKASALNKLEKIDTLQESHTEHLTEHL